MRATFGFAVSFGGIDPTLAFTGVLAGATAFSGGAKALAFAFIDTAAVNFLFDFVGSGRRGIGFVTGFVAGFFTCAGKQASGSECDQGALFDTYHAETMPNPGHLGEPLSSVASICRWLIARPLCRRQLGGLG